MNKMKQKDLLMLAHLRNNARMSLTNISKRTKIPVSTLFDRLKANEDGIIKKYTSLIDFSKLGYHTRANIAFRVEREDKEALKDCLIKSDFVNSIYKINNGYDFMVEGVFKQVKDMHNFIENLESKFKIVDKKMFFIIEDLKRENFMSNPILIGNHGGNLSKCI